MKLICEFETRFAIIQSGTTPEHLLWNRLKPIALHEHGVAGFEVRFSRERAYYFRQIDASVKAIIPHTGWTCRVCIGKVYLNERFFEYLKAII